MIYIDIIALAKTKEYFSILTFYIVILSVTILKCCVAYFYTSIYKNCDTKR